MRDFRGPNEGEAATDTQSAAKVGARTRSQDVSGGVPHRGQMEHAFGQDFSDVRAETGAAKAMGGIGASAAARGNSVAFADANPQPWLVAHELTHVVQNRNAGVADGGPVARKATIGAVDHASEHEANAVADRVAGGQPAGPITASPSAAIQRFSPDGHRSATVGGLKDNFSAEEIGEVYASNWERDFSQGNADIASATLAWLSVKNHATKNKGEPGPSAATFQAAVWKVVNCNITDLTDESLGGYHYWEHLDHPTATFSSPDQAAEKRWKGHSDGLVGYLADGRAHIKDQMVAAIDCYRISMKSGTVGGGIDNWNGAAKPDGYAAPTTVVDASGKGTTANPVGFNDPKVASRDPVKEETKDQAIGAGAKSDPKYNQALWQVVGQHLGRAMHAFEDFWAHSNWLEMAKEGHRQVNAKKPVDTGPAANAKLKTGTFEMSSKCHALGHKLHALASGFKKDMPLMLKVYGRTEQSHKLDSKEAKAGRSTAWGSGDDNDNAMAYGALNEKSWTATGDMTDVATAGNNVEELVLSGKYTMADFLCNSTWLDALDGKGKQLIKQGDTTSDENAHGKIAKDQEEGGSNKDYDMAHAIAIAADAKVFGPLRAVMDEKDATKALAATQAQIAMVDTMMQAPSPSHPMWDLVKV